MASRVRIFWTSPLERLLRRDRLEGRSRFKKRSNDHPIYSTAAIRRPSPASMLNVLAAAGVSMTSRPTLRLANANVSSRGGKMLRLPVPRTTSSGRVANSSSKCDSTRSAMGGGAKPSTSPSGVSAIVCVNDRSPMRIASLDTLRIIIADGFSRVNFNSGFRYHRASSAQSFRRVPTKYQARSNRPDQKV